MNLQKIFDIQKVIDNNIIEKHQELKEQNNLDWKLLALQVELGECANEWRGFKKWNNDQKPGTAETERCESCGGSGFDVSWQTSRMSCEGTGEFNDM